MPVRRLLGYLIAGVGTVGLGVILAPRSAAQVYGTTLPINNPAIHYFEGPLEDAVSHLKRDLESGKVKLDFREDGFGYLPSLLAHLDVHPDSQALVFSKTSFQAPKISPRNPRAIYFNDSVAVGWVRGGDGLEMAALDPRQGIVFYTLTNPKPGQPVITRQQVCLTCHQGPATMGVPGIFVGSVFPNSAGAPAREGAIITDHRTAFEDRWGGWYVNAVHGEQKDRANSMAEDPAEPDVLESEGRQNLPTLAALVSTAGFLSPASDIVALMTFEHQTQMVNLITRLGWEARMGEQEYQISTDLEAVVDYMLFAGEVPLKEPLQGVSTFTKTFPQRGPRDAKGRSLRDFDLQKRLFRYPLSFMIYSPAFDALPDAMREKVYRRVYDVLTEKDRSEKFAHLSSGDRRSILEILRDTKPGLPAYWKDAPPPVN
jgi:hypothetical protein